MVVVLVMGVAPARADLEIWVSTTDNPPVLADKVASTPSGTGFQTVSYTNTSFHGFNISALATSSDSPGSGNFANLTGSTVAIINNSGVTKTLFITIGDTGYAGPFSPPGPVVVQSSLGTTVSVGSAANAITFTSYVNTGPHGAQNAITFSPTGDQSNAITATGSNNNTASANMNTLVAGFSVTERFQITLGNHSNVNFSTNTILTNDNPAAVPEPSTMAIAGLGALGMIGYGLRRRKALGA